MIRSSSDSKVLGSMEVKAAKKVSEGDSPPALKRVKIMPSSVSYTLACDSSQDSKPGSTMSDRLAMQVPVQDVVYVIKSIPKDSKMEKKVSVVALEEKPASLEKNIKATGSPRTDICLVPVSLKSNKTGTSVQSLLTQTVAPVTKTIQTPQLNKAPLAIPITVSLDNLPCVKEEPDTSSDSSPPEERQPEPSVTQTFTLSTPESTTRVQPGGENRRRLRPWLISKIDSGDIPGLQWMNKEKSIFRIPWKHGGKQDWSPQHSQIFMEWAQHTGKYRQGLDKTEWAKWKVRLRCAFNKSPDITELKDLSDLEGDNPYKVYMFKTNGKDVAKHVKAERNRKAALENVTKKPEADIRATIIPRTVDADTKDADSHDSMDSHSSVDSNDGSSSEDVTENAGSCNRVSSSDTSGLKEASAVQMYTASFIRSEKVSKSDQESPMDLSCSKPSGSYLAITPAGAAGDKKSTKTLPGNVLNCNGESSRGASCSERRPYNIDPEVLQSFLTLARVISTDLYQDIKGLLDQKS